jgi:hypothetical protein
MSLERPVSPSQRPRSSVQLAAALLVGMALGAAVVLLTGRQAPRPTWSRVAARAASPDKSRVALVVERPCADTFCQELRIGTSEESATGVTSLEQTSAYEVVWTQDGKRVGFLVDGNELWLYDGQTQAPAGRVKLFAPDGAQSRMARGVTFSENGRAVTFDDCPRGHSGCRAGLVAIPQ